ncbi:MAG: hypothetical protein RKL24_00960, partial [Defluviicoccus sp.]|nr:hypothetical protein [Defluviicoccus sp.]
NAIMPRERRQIIFSEMELYEALLAYNRVAEPAAFEGEPFSLLLTREPAITLVTRVYDRREWREEKVKLPTPFILEAMIRFCIANTISLPRRANKRFLVVQNEACLFVLLDPVKPTADLRLVATAGADPNSRA